MLAYITLRTWDHPKCDHLIRSDAEEWAKLINALGDVGTVEAWNGGRWNS